MEYGNKDMILDLGIGEGGSYILRDQPGQKRLGVDRYPWQLRRCAEKYGICTRLLDLIETGYCLPFPNNSFHKAEIIFPLDELRVALASNWKLWPELRRVVRKNGLVKVITDVPRGGQVEDWPFRISNPHLQIARYAQKSGFEVRVRKMTRDETAELGSYWSEQILPYQDVERGPLSYLEPVTVHKVLAVNVQNN